MSIRISEALSREHQFNAREQKQLVAVPRYASALARIQTSGVSSLEVHRATPITREAMPDDIMTVVRTWRMVRALRDAIPLGSETLMNELVATVDITPPPNGNSSTGCALVR